jgi:hypothetical protein
MGGPMKNNLVNFFLKLSQQSFPSRVNESTNVQNKAALQLKQQIA